jgi:4-amino-4-deoxy-L-arabinose transferase-like glycosyltransferase
MTQNEIWPKGFRGLSFLIIILGIFFSFEMGNRPFASPDEGRYVEIPREMVVTGDYVTPRLDGMKYFEKPPLFYWMQAASIEAAGINETSMRFWVVLFAILGCLSVFYVGAKCYSRNVGVMSAGILATTLIYYCHSRIIILDLVLSILLCGSLWAFFLAFVKKNQSKIPKKYLIIAMYALSALACLTKGLIGAVLPGFVVFLWMLFTNNWKKLKEILYIPGILGFLVIFLPWHVLAAQRNHDFLYYYFVVEHFLRYTTKFHNRYQPAWFFIPIILAGLIPWTGLSLMSLKNMVKKSVVKNSENIFLACWIFGIFGFFSFSHSKLIPYILPIVPPIALATAVFIEECGEKEFRIGAIINIILFFSAGIAYYFARGEISDVLQNADARTLLNVVIISLVTIGIVFLLAIFSKISKKMAVVICIFLSGNMLWTVNKLAPYYQDEKKPTTRKVAKYIRANKTKDDLVFIYNYYHQDFPVYLNDTTGVINFVGELEFGSNSEPEKSNLISEEKFWELWNTTNQRIFLVLSRGDYRDVFAKRTQVHNVLIFDENFIAISNK